MLPDEMIRRVSRHSFCGAIRVTATDGDLTSLKFCHGWIPRDWTFITLGKEKHYNTDQLDPKKFIHFC
jgi:hypothetical protein